MKTLITILSALAFVSAASVASAAPSVGDQERTFWEQQSLYGA
jgi:hypothetical protein